MYNDLNETTSSGFYGEYHQAVKQYGHDLDGKSVDAGGYNYTEIQEKLVRQEQAVIRRLYERCAAVAEKYADEPVPPLFPDVHYKVFRSTNERTGKQTIWGIDYFQEMSACFSGNYSAAPGRVGNTMYRAGQLARRIWAKPDFGVGMMVFCFFMAAVLVFASGVLPIVPEAADWLLNGPYGFWARAVLGTVMTIGSYAMSGMISQERGPVTRGLGLVHFLVVVASFLAGASMTVSYPDAFSPLYVLPFAGYYGLMILALIIDGIVDGNKKNRDRSGAKKEFLELWGLERGHAERYVRLHEAWWKAEGAGKREPAGLVNLRRDVARFEKYYQELRY